MRSIASRLAGIAETGGDTLAVAGLTGRVSYRVFEDWTNDLANRINAAAGMEPRVCLVVAGFDVQAIVGMFATLKTPHIFLAVDGQSLPANIAGIAASTGAGVVVHDAAAAEAVRTAGLDLPLVPVGPAPEGPVQVPPVQDDPTRVALYKRTSGSTGGAKTAAHTAAGILDDATQGARILELSPEARLAVVSTFDAALTSAATLRVILAGGALLPVDLRFESPKHAVERLIGEGLTHIYNTPTALRLLCEGLPEGAVFPDLRSVLLGGEKTTTADVRLLTRVTPPGAHLRSTFASTETQLVAHTSVSLEDDVAHEGVRELKIAEGVRVDILDDDGAPKPVGETGHVRVTSQMITLGYQGDVDPATAAKVTHNADGTRSYMTDDMGYLTPEGALVLIGRAGREVKIRGRRVDLGALEGWLTRQDDIAEAAVVVQPLGADGGPRLAAFIKPDRGFESPSALRKRMQAELIASMQPAAIVVVEDLPRTPNQKINRRALESDLSHLEADSGETLEAEGLLGELAEIWAGVLKRAVTGPEKDFFDLGGDSIAATVAAVQMEERLGLPVDTGFVYRYPMLAEQVAALEEMRDSAATGPGDRLLVPLTIPGLDGTPESGTLQKVFLISGAGGHVFPFAPVAQELRRDWEVIGVLHPVVLDSEPELASVEDYAARMERAIRASQPQGPYFLIGYSFGAAVAHEIGRRMAEQGEAVGVVSVDLQMLSLAPWMYKLWFYREKLRGLFAREKDRPAERGFLDDPELDPVERGKLSMSIRRMARLLNSYRPGPSGAPTIVVVAETQDEPYQAEDLGWGRVARLLRVVRTPGNHLDLFKDGNMKGFARLMDDCLNRLARENRVDRPG